MMVAQQSLHYLAMTLKEMEILPGTLQPVDRMTLDLE